MQVDTLSNQAWSSIRQRLGLKSVQIISHERTMQANTAATDTSNIKE
jgi:hypothetical protein